LPPLAGILFATTDPTGSQELSMAGQPLRELPAAHNAGGMHDEPAEKLGI